MFAQYDYYIYDIENTFDGVYDERFATILLLDTSWEFKFPVIDLAKGNALQLSFDMLVDEVYDLYVVFSPCSPEWQILDEPITDFIEGFNENPIFDYSFLAIH